MNSFSTCRKRLARLRCIQHCIDCFKNRKPLPRALCYVAQLKTYTLAKDAELCVYAEPCKKSTVLKKGAYRAGLTIQATGEEMFNNSGRWQHVRGAEDQQGDVVDFQGWLLLVDTSMTDTQHNAVQLEEKRSCRDPSMLQQVFRRGSECLELNNWEEVLEYEYSLISSAKPRGLKVVPLLEEAVDLLSMPPPQWSLDHDEDLAVYLGSQVSAANDRLGNMKNYVDSIDVSSSCEEENQENLTDGSSETYWESDGHQAKLYLYFIYFYIFILAKQHHI